MPQLNFFGARHAVSMAAAILVGFFIEHYFSFTHQGWIVLSLFAVSQVTRGAPLQQGLMAFALTLFAVVSASFLNVLGVPSYILLILGVLLVVAVGFATIWRRPLVLHVYYLCFLFPIMFLVAVSLPMPDMQTLANRMLDTLIGGLIGLGFVAFILPAQPYKELASGLLPVIKSLIEYSQALQGYIDKQSAREDILSSKASDIERVMQGEQSLYPEWVFETGFNPGLRGGFRFFVLYLERVIDLFLSTHQLLIKSLDQFDFDDIADELRTSLQKNQMLLDVLRRYFSGEEYRELDDDFTSDQADLEARYKEIVPGGLEYLDLAPSMLALTVLVRNIRDIRKLLLQLIAALPDKAPSGV